MDENVVPKWAIRPFRDFLEYIEDLIQLTHVSARGLSMLRAAPQLMEAVQKAEAHEVEPSESQQDTDVGEASARLKRVREEADLEAAPIGWQRLVLDSAQSD